LSFIPDRGLPIGRQNRDWKSNDRIGRITAVNFAAFDLNLLRVFDALMRERSATRAGERVGLSQPAVSAALNRLRHALGDELFVRQQNEMVPTPRAMALAAPIRAALAEIEQAFNSMAGFDPAGAQREFRLLGADFFSMLLMPELWQALSRAAPGISLRFVDTGRGEIDRLLSDDLIDMALEGPMFAPPEWISREVLFRSPFTIVAARGHAALAAAGISEGGVIPLDLFCELPQALRSSDGSTSGFVSDALARIGRKRRVVLTLPHFYAIGRAVARGGLIAAVPVQFARACAEELRLAMYSAPIEVPAPDICLFWHRRHDQDPAHRWLRAQITAASREFVL
jgi:DNA-binding transcriptional LysR family regulator